MADYAYYEFTRDWPDLLVAINRLEVALRRNGRPVAADMLLKGYGNLQREMLELGKRMAAFATEELRRQERQTRVRPDTAGGGGPRLGDYLVAETLPGQAFLPGSIGVANETVLDAEVPWWWTNEEGYSGNVGRTLFGTFYGAADAAPPRADEFRVHPLFEAGPNGTLAGLGEIHNPIPARRFIEKAIPIINREWHAGFSAAKTRFDAEMARALATVV